MNINTVYRCPYYGNNLECPKECDNYIPPTLLIDEFDLYKPFFCDRNGVLIDNDKNSICQITIDADIEYSLQNAIDYISKCKVRGEKGDIMAEYVGGKPVVVEKGDEFCEDYKLYRSISGNAQELLNLISDTLFTINKGGDKVKGLAYIEGYLEGFQMLMDALRYIDPPANFGDKEGE